ncbi:hypothetical protein EIP91_001096 [Steccherinum ochraceum]|uniref:Glucose-methanol-choline oxidoreductase N-terminal domain-containing protein n=1 Tax=Steccherinum ochraceum TaxID=92696 RepID=A0A4R0RN30_9APHY|nr:hypothetical protein EIP91_001096 [Steccherinum ochraceum]
MSQPTAEFDIIFAGGGTTACVAAGRLAAADPSLKILVVEAGPHTQEDPKHLEAGRFFHLLVPGGKTARFNIASPENTPQGRAMVATATAQCLGGGSSLNFVMYNRAAASEYNEWESKFSNPGWGSKDLLPLLKKCETYEIDPNAETHGSSGPLHVSYGASPSQIGQQFLDVASQYDKDRTFTEDSNDLHTVNAYARWPKFIDGKTGRRADTAHGYIYGLQGNKNLQVVAGAHVKRIIIENGRAVGVEYVSNAQVNPDATTASTIAYAKKQIVVSAGSWGSPAILERSGVGSAAVLGKLGIKQVVDLPGVGERLQDHFCSITTHIASDESVTLDAIAQGNPAEIEKWHNQWVKDGTGLMAGNAMDAGIKYRPTETELQTIGPKFRAVWDSLYANAPDRSVMWLGASSVCLTPGVPPTPGQKYFGVGYFLNQPNFIGSTHITSADDPNAPYDYNPGDIDNEADMEFHVYAYKLSREFARRMACFRGEHPAQVPAFPEGSAALLKGVTAPVPADAPNVQYTAEDDKAIRDMVKKFSMIANHAAGTCAMMAREQGGVVDSRLNVYGVAGLKVADLSISPVIVGANTYSTAVVIGEKAAVLIAEDLGISVV